MSAKAEETKCHTGELLLKQVLVNSNTALLLDFTEASLSQKGCLINVILTLLSEGLITGVSLMWEKLH